MKRDEPAHQPVHDDEDPATEYDTRAHLLARSNRTFAPIPKVFVQNPDRRRTDRRAPLSEFVKNRDLRGLQAFCLLHAIISSDSREDGWSTTLPISVWARALGTTRHASLRSASAAASKILKRLADRRLIERRRAGQKREITVTLLRPDGSGQPYTRPGKDNEDRYLKLTNDFWTDGWHDKLDIPATAMLLVALHEKPGFELATERVPEWYGWSPDTAERGMRRLKELNVLKVEKRAKKAPLAPMGQTIVNVYTLLPPFEVET